MERVKRFEAGIGGYPGPSYQVMLEDGRLHYRVWRADGPATETVVDPTPEAWGAFLRAVEEAGLWSWAPRYASPGLIMDGTHWSIELEVGERRVVSSGSNAYPPGFEQVTRAVSALLGGLRFS